MEDDASDYEMVPKEVINRNVSSLSDLGELLLTDFFLVKVSTNKSINREGKSDTNIEYRLFCKEEFAIEFARSNPSNYSGDLKQSDVLKSRFAFMQSPQGTYPKMELDFDLDHATKIPYEWFLLTYIMRSLED